jgi:hypothetical protein
LPVRSPAFWSCVLSFPSWVRKSFLVSHPFIPFLSPLGSRTSVILA